MRLKTLIVLVLLSVVAAVVAWPSLDFYLLTGKLFPIHKVDVLQNPVTVKSWNADGLLLADGRRIQLPGLRALPSESAALTAATKRVELTKDGHVFGLMLIHHWCGNDPVREHIARVDLSDAMTFLQIGQPVGRIPQPRFIADKRETILPNGAGMSANIIILQGG